MAKIFSDYGSGHLLVTYRLQVRNHFLVSYREWDYLPCAGDVDYGKVGNNAAAVSVMHEWKRENMKKARKMAYTYNKLGILSPGAKKRMSRAVDVLILGARKKYAISPKTGRRFSFYLSFITLTVSSKRIVKHSEAKVRLLHPFLRWLRRTCKANAYVWKAELQARGQIHYHVITDCFVDYRVLRSKWNELQQRAGYLDDFYREHGHFDANSTDIHAVFDEKQVGNYLKKYFWKDYYQKKEEDGVWDMEEGKEESERIIDGKVWDCSVNLKQAKYFSVEFNDDIEKSLQKAMQNGDVEMEILDNFTIYRFRCNIRRVLPRSVCDEVREYYRKIVEKGYDDEIVELN